MGFLEGNSVPVLTYRTQGSCTLFSVYSVTIPLRVSGFLVAYHQEVAMYICDNRYVLYVLVDGRRDRRQSTNTPVPFHSGCSQQKKRARNISITVCAAPTEDELVMLEICRGP
jgi:hypothetical protein